ncbi:MAG: hypothetical protein QMD21_03165 [Candidatus Thermoplasmatota archaeon]|nr:hypothetical protein [Candidatus Thermoplasmatota archaeon]MDI6887072.1 hypothetical protein [Candidatus Thermoplasmatota archaeon]
MSEEKVKLIVENLEPYSKWLELEYRHCTELWDKVIFTNVKDAKLKECLRKLSNVEVLEESVIELEHKKRIVLDPLAKRALTRADYDGIEEIVIGGILGNEKLTGKTKLLITDRLKKSDTKARNLGKSQLSIDIAAFVAKLVYLGMGLKDIDIADELEILFDNSYSIILPYGYPIIGGNVIITPKLVDYLSSQ